jgi:hypothetical protein
VRFAANPVVHKRPLCTYSVDLRPGAGLTKINRRRASRRHGVTWFVPTRDGSGRAPSLRIRKTPARQADDDGRHEESMVDVRGTRSARHSAADREIDAPYRSEWPTMIRNKRVRRAVAVALMVLGALLMLLAPPVWIGAIPLALGIVVELMGIAIERQDRR